jgi:aspartate kinase
MRVFKFGGASCNSIERIQNLPTILNKYRDEQIVMIISAMGKTTNALEIVAQEYYKGNCLKSVELLNEIKQLHLTTSQSLLKTSFNICAEKLQEYFIETEKLLHSEKVYEYDFYYDQIVSIGELLSTCIISFYLNEVGINNHLLDVRTILKTDDNYREATINWNATQQQIAAYPFHQSLTITQGFIGSTPKNFITTLGREGSDYTAAVFANLLNAESLTIWKDVDGVMNADPKSINDAQLIHELSFNEVIEMSYYGAQVIHPKTIKPLQNKGIPLYVKSFINIDNAGTVISAKAVNNLPPIIVVKTNQVLIHLHTKDFSFVGEEPMAALYKIFSTVKIKPNLIQTGAISIQICLDNWEEKIEQLKQLTAHLFNIDITTQLQLLTIRHYTNELKNNMLANKDVLLIQQSKETFQALYLS